MEVVTETPWCSEQQGRSKSSSILGKSAATITKINKAMDKITTSNMLSDHLVKWQQASCNGTFVDSHLTVAEP